ncbi:hypothetical protein AGMMS49525_17890 [Bacteroidia bacterium]|nr:hypothetical protein AGMMS49525_17890 [Bacteroidia bacterium]
MRQGELKRDRNKLGIVFVTEFQNKIIEQFDFDTFVEQLENAGANRVVLFCVEGKADACHRSIVANELNKRYKFEIEHL